MMSARANNSLVLSIWLIILAVSGLAKAERWSRQVSNSDWIPLASPRNQQAQASVAHGQNLPPLSQIHQPLIPASLPPELRQEYQQQLLQLQKTQESIQRILLLQQELKAQQQLLQGQGFLPNGIAEGEENKPQALQQGLIPNHQTLPHLPGDVLVPPPQLSGEVRPPVYTSQNFPEPQGETIVQEQYEDYSDRQAEDYRNAERTRESQRDKEKYVPEAPTGTANTGEGTNDGEEEVQVVYVPTEVLAQRDQLKNQRGRDRKQYGNQNGRPNHQQHHQRPFANQRGQSSVESTSRERENIPTTISPQEDAYAREFLEQLQREHEGTDRLLKEARQKELNRLREERKEIQRQAKLQQAALEREQEIQRQREAEKKRKELAKLEETAKQRELERIRETREKQRQEELERAKKAQARANEEKRKQEEARQAEIERLALLERKKKAEIERTIKAQKELERVQKADEEREREAERNFPRQKESTRHRQSESDESPQAQPLIRSQQVHQQHQTHTGKYNRQHRIRNKPRQRQQNHVNSQNLDSFEQNRYETTTAPPSPNQPPLAVYMINLRGDSRAPRVSDVLKTLKDAKTIDVLDNVGQDAPQVFVGPSSLEVPTDYAKFDLPYLSAIDNNRVERRVDKLPFFVAPLSFNPPPGYAKIPFPAPHIGSVVVNTLDNHITPTQPDQNFEDGRKPNLNPLIEPNSFIESSNQGTFYSTTYDSPTTPSYTNYRQEEPSSTPQYQSTPSYSSVEASGPGRDYRIRQQYTEEQPNSSGSQEQAGSRPTFQEQSQLRPAYHEESPLPQSNHPSQYSDESSGSTTPTYRRPNVVTSFTYQESPQPVSSTPVYQESYSQVREDSTLRHPNAQVASGHQDLPPHRKVAHRYQQENDRGQEYTSGQVDSVVNNYEDNLRGPTQYSLPAELPPIIPQLPGLVNSLLDESEQAAFVNRPEPTTTQAPTTTTTTTETPTTTLRYRGRHRGRVVATRPSTTTTTVSPLGKSRDTDKTRRPSSRTRFRFTATTEEYRDTYDPKRSKVSETTQRYNAQDSFRRPAAAKTQKFKSRDSEVSLQASRNQAQDVQAHEADGSDRNPVLDSNPRHPEQSGLDAHEPLYQQYNFASSTTGLENYPVPSGVERQPVNSGGEVDYPKNLNYPQTLQSPVDHLRNQEESIGQQYQEQFPTNEFTPQNLENAPINGFNYQTRNEHVKATPTIPPTSRDYAFYQNKQENFQASQEPLNPSEALVNSPVHDFRQPETYQKPQDTGSAQREDLTRPEPQFPVHEDKTLNYGTNDGTIYDPYSPDNQDSFRTTGLAPEQAPLEVTTVMTTTTSTTAAPVVIRQRVRGRVGGRGRPDSHIQTRPRGSQDEYVRFSAVNNQNTPTTERPTTRRRESPRPRTKPRHQYQGIVQVQTEGDDYVRIQAPIRTYQKTIVTPPSKTHRTTTTQSPTTTTVQYEDGSNDGLEYGFIRPPNFNPIHPVDNRHQNLYKPNDNQAQLQSIGPIDETAEDSSLSHTQVSRTRPKYQSPNRRPSIKPTTTTTHAPEISSYVERSRTRVEEPKNNRIRVRGRKPGRRRTTTTTTTTTEYILEDTNDLPLDENYPRRVERIQDPINDRQGLYEKFESLPLTVGPGGNPGQQQNGGNPYTGQDFILNFGSEPASSEPDQTQLASQPVQKYGPAFGSRSRTHSAHRGGHDRDIHGAESQWSTKLTSSSFQPSPSVNRLPQDDQKTSNFFENEKNKYSNDQVAADAPEIITAAPEEAYVTVLVTSDDKGAKSVSADDMDNPTMEGTNFGMKTGVESQSNAYENTTSTSGIQDSIGLNSVVATNNSPESIVNSGTKNFGDLGTNNVPTRRVGMRRRRVRVRVRPAPIDDFVTAESQHFNSAVNSLVHDRLKFNPFNDESKEVPTTFQPPIEPQEYASSETPEKTMIEDFFDEMFKPQNKSSEETEVNTSVKDQDDNITTTEQNLDVYEHQQHQETSWNNFRPETTTKTLVNHSNTDNDAELNEPSSNPPITTTTNLPRKSWDSTKQFIDSIAMQSGEYLPNSKYPENDNFDENISGQGNEIFRNDYRQNIATNDDNSAREDNNDENYPKNHRSEWSEVRYPTDRDLFNYNRQLNLTATQLPGVVTKSEGDNNVKTLSDYVKAIFDTMKNADEQKTEQDDFSTTDPNFKDAEDTSASTTNYSASVDQIDEKDFTTITAPTDFSTVSKILSSGAEKSEESLESTTVKTKAMETVGKSEDDEESDELSVKIDNPQVTTNFEVSSGPENNESTEPIETEGTTMKLGLSTEISTDEISTSSQNKSEESSETSTTQKIKNSNVTQSDDVSKTTTTENSAMAISTSKLTGVLRTSTTTKVSHMTEICYRGRCVMTKPKKDFRSR